MCQRSRANRAGRGVNRYTVKPLPATRQYIVLRVDAVDAARGTAAPVGFRTDGASVPRALWSFVGSPFAPDVLEAAIDHDHAYQFGVPDRRSADDLFRTALVKRGASRFRARLYWLGVRAFGWFYWRRCRYGRGIGG